MSYSPTSGVRQTGLVSLGKRISGDSASHAKGEIAERDGTITVRALCTRCSLGTPLVPDDGHDDGHERDGHNDRWHKGGNCIAHQPSLSIPAVPITAQLRAKHLAQVGYSGLTSGKRIVSRNPPAPVKLISSRSTPIPMPPAGGMPYSSAWMKSSSSRIASLSPRAAASAWTMKRSR